MKNILLILFLGLSLMCIAQDNYLKKNCEYTTIENSDGTEFTSTKDYLMYEKVFGVSSTFMFFSLSNPEGIPVLNFQLLAKSKEFPKVYCLDKSSKIYIQLLNGKIVTLISALEEQCSGLIYDSNDKNNIRVLTGKFLFTKGSLEDLEKYPIAFIRVKYTNETVDYPMKKELDSESLAKKYSPESYFKDNLKCIQ